MKYQILRTETDLRDATESLRNSAYVACDTETTGLSPKIAKLLSVQFSDGNSHFLVPSSEGVELGPLSTILADKSVTKIFHNARFDLAFLNDAGYQTETLFDTMIAEKILTRGGDQSVSLAETLYRYFAIDLDKGQRAKFGSGWTGVWSEEMVEYAMNDVAYLPELMRQQTEWLEKLGETDRYSEALEKMLSGLER